MDATHHLIWNVDPILLQLGPLVVRWYGVCFALAILLSYEVDKRILGREGWSRVSIDLYLGYVVAGTVIGARLGHCLFYEPGYYLSHPIEILFVWQGGLASHGGAAGILIATWFFVRKHNYPYLMLADRVAVCAPVASTLIRMGNLFNSEIIGHPTTVPWAIVFERVDMLPRHPTQLYEALFYAVTTVLVITLYYRTDAGKRPGVLLGTVLAVIFGFRFCIEFLKEYQSPFEAQLPLDLGQLLSIPAVLLGVWLIWRGLRRPVAVVGRA